MTRLVNAVVRRPLPPLRASYTPRFVPQYAVLKLVKDGLHWSSGDCSTATTS